MIQISRAVRRYRIDGCMVAIIRLLYPYRWDLGFFFFGTGYGTWPTRKQLSLYCCKRHHTAIWLINMHQQLASLLPHMSGTHFFHFFYLFLFNFLFRFYSTVATTATVPPHWPRFCFVTSFITHHLNNGVQPPLSPRYVFLYLFILY